jgi:predicted dehydrogenase
LIRVGLIGCGRIARVHVPYIRSYKGAEIIGVCDCNPEQAKILARHFNIAGVYTDPKVFLAEQHPDVVHILTPPQTHAELAIFAMEAGIHVLVEKPMAVSVAEADRMIETARRMKVRLCVDHNRLFDPVVLKAQQMVADGILGEVVGVEAFQGIAHLNANNSADGLPSKKGWVSELPGGVLQNVGPHSIALLLAFMRAPRPVSVVTKRTGLIPGAPFEEVRAIFEGEKALGTLTFSLSPEPYLNFLNLYGSKASLQINLNNMTLIIFKDRRLPKLLTKSWFNIDQSLQLLSNTMKSSLQVLTGKMKFYPGMGTLIRRYYACLENGGLPPVSGEEGREVVKVLDLICQQGQGYQRPKIVAGSFQEAVSIKG